MDFDHFEIQRSDEILQIEVKSIKEKSCSRL